MARSDGARHAKPDAIGTVACGKPLVGHDVPIAQHCRSRATRVA
jgi:hypothetical protein